jgi:CRISPR/Cas system CSM-associated protein Csm3 (group 7 of RAMP superfamily)
MTVDFSTFASRLHFKGQLVFTSAMRIGAEKSLAVDTPDTPVLRDATGLPYIPGSSFKGALRSYVESIARAFQARDDVADCNLACIPVGRPATRPREDNDPRTQVCLYQDEVTWLKRVQPEAWHQTAEDGAAPAGLQQRLPASQAIKTQVSAQGAEAARDAALRDLSCWTCRLFGTQWLASKVLIKDLYLNEATFFHTQIRDGVGIDRDAGRAAQGLKYQFEVVPAGAAFELELLAENATEAELGLLWLGIEAFVRGEVLLGGAKSRGLGWCELQPDWPASRYVNQGALLDLLLPPATGAGAVGLDENAPLAWMQAFARAIGLEGGHDA